jgi:hypothetical protein
VVFNAGFLELANHYGFQPRACKPYRPRTKGKTERMVGYVKHHFFVRYRHVESLTHLNQQLEQWLETVADQRPLRQFQQTPASRFVEEYPALQPLPTRDFDTRYFDVRHVAWDGYIEVRGQRYSVPEAYCGQSVEIRITLDELLQVYHHDQLVAEHRLNTGVTQWHTVPEHHHPLWQTTCKVASRPLSDYEGCL